MRVLWGIISIICALLAAAGFVFVFAGLKDVLRALHSRRWPTVPGTVLSAEEVEHRLPVPGQTEPRVHYEARVQYEYSVGRVLVGTATLRVDPAARTNPDDAQATLRRYPPGQAVRVAYNPEDPTDAVLEPGAHAPSFVRLVVGLGLVGVGICIPFITRWFMARV
ncbi:DUF3592 domain-containing protein [Myxococcus qinghaiensis]|uniref:DUF3592 domain-containing protein n=1 Tax=Myxococcus qinghaiensis TaxID=2906758 RepID=UPI0020A73154|nr:DUF3592 domain-containing protein [Myxococcus qinghaiensis]MCP3168789.1 DUF3592 domain-containing protein [Myxococcus qinghaiensis]